jgi:hypothetical protein
MLYLAEFSVMNPSFGLLFWTAIIFMVVVFVLSRFFKTIKDALKAREHDIDSALQSAEQARIEMARLEEAQKNLERHSLTVQPGPFKSKFRKETFAFQENAHFC